MLERTYELRLSEPIADVFSALAATIAVGRWDTLIDADDQSGLPRRGCRYCTQRRGRVYRGQVIECLRPVSLIISETLHRSPSHVQMRMKWRIEPISDGTILIHEVRAALNRAAGLKRRNWERKIASDASQIFTGIITRLQRATAIQPSTVTIGQSTGNRVIVNAKMTNVSGKPILR